ncbi:MAG: hypothetical protein CMI06_06595 [Oceanospirillaceae bacterium]|nr:hypothetical protein [Oceanospirillaceae bacterium]
MTAHTGTLRSVLLAGMMIVLLLANRSQAAPDSIRVTMLNPSTPANLFWNMQTQFMQAAAEDLGIDLEIVYGADNRFHTTQQAYDILNRENPPDYLICNYFFSQGWQILQAAEKAGVYTLLISTDIPQQDQKDAGTPQDKFPHFLARIMPDDRQASYELSRQLIAEGRHLSLQGASGKLELIGISGMRDTSATVLRNEGLLQAINEQDNTLLMQLVHANWSANTAQRQSWALLQRYPSASLIWTASDVMAMAVIQQAQALGRHAGKDILIVGTNWTAEALNAIDDGSLFASAGGQFMDGALALAIIYDHANGKGPDAQEANILRHMDIITHSNLARYRQLLDPQRWQSMNFRSLTRSHGTSAQKYAFDTRDVMQRLLLPANDTVSNRPHQQHRIIH